jgi:hypothetical protein
VSSGAIESGETPAVMEEVVDEVNQQLTVDEGHRAAAAADGPTGVSAPAQPCEKCLQIALP